MKKNTFEHCIWFYVNRKSNRVSPAFFCRNKKINLNVEMLKVILSIELVVLTVPQRWNAKHAMRRFWLFFSIFLMTFVCVNKLTNTTGKQQFRCFQSVTCFQISFGLWIQKNPRFCFSRQLFKQHDSFESRTNWAYKEP